MGSDEAGTALRNTLRHGAVCYLQIPAVNLTGLGAFYEQVFGWELEAGYPSFEAPGLLGQFVGDRSPVAGAGVLVWISVASVDEALAAVAAAGGSVVDPPSDDGPDRVLATILDPAGNALGIVAHRTSGHDGATPAR